MRRTIDAIGNSFMSFGFATAEFEVTAERLGVYLPVTHIDNPKVFIPMILVGRSLIFGTRDMVMAKIPGR
jgi:Heterokaryon incompatibility protein Het-C